MTGKSLDLEILGENTERAKENREYFAAEGLLVVNVCGGPGSGKTTLISALCSQLKGSVAVGAVEGDIASDIDTGFLLAQNVPAVQINTMGGCHLTAAQVYRGVRELGIKNGIVFIENIGNLVCPASFDLGEACRIVTAGVPEGADKPYKYITMYESAHIAVLTKCDLAEVFGFDREYFRRGVRSVMPRFELFETSKDPASAESLAKRLLELKRQCSAKE